MLYRPERGHTQPDRASSFVNLLRPLDAVVRKGAVSLHCPQIAEPGFEKGQRFTNNHPSHVMVKLLAMTTELLPIMVVLLPMMMMLWSSGAERIAISILAFLSGGAQAEERSLLRVSSRDARGGDATAQEHARASVTTTAVQEWRSSTDPEGMSLPSRERQT